MYESNFQMKVFVVQIFFEWLHICPIMNHYQISLEQFTVRSGFNHFGATDRNDKSDVVQSVNTPGIDIT